MSQTERRWVSLHVDIILDVPKGINTESQEGQDFLRAEFIDYLQSAKYLMLDFEIGEEEDE
jgi:hypothetical protein